ncbi:hypothetical protein DV735_g3551, partial [Chaetothyriales sp. CBS 134920]
MAATNRTLFFSCPYAFNPIGVTEFLERFNNGLESEDDAVFVAYDDRTHLFSLTVDRSDTRTAPYFVAQLKVFTDQHVKYPDVFEPRIYHKQEPTPRQPVHHGTLAGTADLLDLDDTENSDDAEEDVLQAMNHVTSYWCPKDGDIRILTTSVAENIASLTDSAVYPEAQANQVRLVGGDFGAALRKLHNMEALLALQHSQRLQKTARANANILLLTTEDPNPSMRFWPVSDPDRPSFSRVMVESRSAFDLERKYICEKYVTDELGNREPPVNLKGLNFLETRELGQSRIWANYVYKSIGEESNMEPQLAQDVGPAVKAQPSPPDSVVETNAFLEPVKAAQVAAWSGQINELTDPYTAKPPPEEPTSSRRRLRSSVQEKPGANTTSLPFVGEKQPDDLISICTTQPAESVQAQDTMPPGTKTGLSIFPGEGRKFTETATVISNLLDQNSEIGSPADEPTIKPTIPTKKSKQNTATNPFSILGSDDGCGGPGGLVESATEASRAFNGLLRFEVQLGQAMLTPGCDEIYRDKVIVARNWDKILGTPHPNGPMTVFSNMLTSNGTDVDRVLEAKFKGSKMWEQSTLSEIKVTYEFHCQSKQGQDFWLVVNEDGSYSVRNERATIGMVAMHYPVRVWDAAAVLKGQEVWEHPPRPIAEGIEELIKSIYILPGRRQLAMTFRQPKNLEITVRKVLLRRISMHQSGIDSCEHVFLQVSEVKTLATKIHPNDRRLWQAFEKEHVEMVEDNSVYYELSIVDSIINNGFEANKTLEVGELTPASVTGANLLTDESIGKLTELAMLMLGKMDWVGAENAGTQARWMIEKQQQARQQQQSLPPTARSRMQQSILPASMVTSRVGGSIVAGGRDGYTFVGEIDIPGPRAKTKAAVYRDSMGKLFALGMGGARVPIPDMMRMEWDGAGLSTIGEEVGPDDSASQYGVPGGARATMPSAGLARRGVASSTERSRGPPNAQSNDAGFW